MDPNRQIPTQPKPKLFLIFLGLFLVLLAGIGGYYLGQRKTSITQQVKSPSPVPTQETDPTANWKTYQNDVYGFKFEYPSDWNLELPDGPGYPQIVSPDKKSNIVIFGYPKGGISGQVILDNHCNNGKNHINLERHDLKIGNIPAIYCTDKNSSSRKLAIFFLVQKDDFQIELEGYFDKSSREKSIKLFDQILSTFKFLDSNQSSSAKEIKYSYINNWSEYKSPTGYSFQMPTDSSEVLAV
jgi:hypothetical protein